MKKLMVAGCSFSAVSRTLPGTSWSEILAEKLGWELVNLARLGCSNGGIRIQIEEIRRQQPDFAIITPTFWDRMEIPVRGAPYTWSQRLIEKTKQILFNGDLEEYLKNSPKNGYDKDSGIDNINYGDNNYNMICEPIWSLAENTNNPYRTSSIDDQTQASIRNYVDRIYDQSWKRQMDQWIITEGVLQMFHDGINFLVMPGILWLNAREEWREIFPKVIPDKFIMLDPMQSQYEISKNLFPIDKTHAFLKGTDPGYHTSEQGQEHIADNWYKHISNKFPETCSKYTKKRAPKNL
jgi:hypothetical protein